VPGARHTGRAAREPGSASEQRSSPLQVTLRLTELARRL